MPSVLDAFNQRPARQPSVLDAFRPRPSTPPPGPLGALEAFRPRPSSRDVVPRAPTSTPSRTRRPSRPRPSSRPRPLAATPSPISLAPPKAPLAAPAAPAAPAVGATPSTEPATTFPQTTETPPHIAGLNEREEFQREFWRWMQQQASLGLGQSIPRYQNIDNYLNQILSSQGAEGAGLLPLSDILGFQQQHAASRSQEIVRAAQREQARRGLSGGAVTAGTDYQDEAARLQLTNESESVNAAIQEQQRLRHAGVMSALGLGQAAGRDFLGLSRDVVTSIGEGVSPHEFPPWWHQLIPRINWPDIPIPIGGRPRPGPGGGGPGPRPPRPPVDPRGGGPDIPPGPPVDPGGRGPGFPPPNPPLPPEDPGGLGGLPCTCPDGRISKTDPDGKCACASAGDPDYGGGNGGGNGGGGTTGSGPPNTGSHHGGRTPSGGNSGTNRGGASGPGTGGSNGGTDVQSDIDYRDPKDIPGGFSEGHPWNDPSQRPPKIGPNYVWVPGFGWKYFDPGAPPDEPVDPFAGPPPGHDPSRHRPSIFRSPWFDPGTPPPGSEVPRIPGHTYYPGIGYVPNNENEDWGG